MLLTQNSIAQGWVESNKGINSFQELDPNDPYLIRFKNDGPLSNWIYGGYLDQDSLFRVVGYREGAKWVSPPFYFNRRCFATDIAMYGDTLYVFGSFWSLFDQKRSVWLPPTGLIKYHNDSIWVEDIYPISPTLGTSLTSVATKGDSIIVYGGVYYAPPKVIEYTYMSGDRGITWNYPFSIVHPIGNTGDMGNLGQVSFLDNGDILMLNGIAPLGSPFNGLIKWDGQRWKGFGTGISSLSQAGAFIVYKGEIYLAGNFSKRFHPDDPGDLIARWDGSSWHNVGGGIWGDVAGGFFIHDDILYCKANSDYIDTITRFGDATIPYLAGWNGHQWCGTPTIPQLTYPPTQFSIINDTLFGLFSERPGILNGDSAVYFMYFDGDYLHGPNSICSTLGIGEEEHSIEKSGISIYPNPTNGILNISLPIETSKARLSLYSLSGQLVFEQQLHQTANRLKLPAALNGLYLVVVESDGQVFTEKVLVESE